MNLDPRTPVIVGAAQVTDRIDDPTMSRSALDLMEDALRSAAIDVIVIDSVAALVSRQELDGQMGDTTVGLQARMMSQAMRRLTAAIAKTKYQALRQMRNTR